MILSGSSNSTCVEHAAQQWGRSPRQSSRLLRRAWSEVREDVNVIGVDRQEMLCWSIHQLMAADGEGVRPSSRPSLSVPVVNLMGCRGKRQQLTTWSFRLAVLTFRSACYVKPARAH